MFLIGIFVHLSFCISLGVLEILYEWKIIEKHQLGQGYLLVFIFISLFGWAIDTTNYRKILGF